MEMQSRNREKTYYKLLFYVAMIAAIFVFFCTYFITRGAAAGSILYIDIHDTFMDFFNSVVNTAVDPYADAGIIYPPLCTIFYRAILHMISPNVFQEIIIDATPAAQPEELKLFQGFWIPFILYAAITFIIFIIALERFKGGKLSEKILFIAVLLLSSPVLFLFERGNILFVALISSILYFSLYDSEKKWKRELALICLAVAFAVKIYPIVFGVLLLRDKRWKEILRLIVYCIVLFVLPFFMFNGFESMKLFIKQLMGVSSSQGTAMTFGGQLNFSKSFMYINEMLGWDIPNLQSAAQFFNWLLTGLAIISLFILKERWKVAAVGAALIAGFPGMSISYVLVFFIIPIVLLLDSNERNKILNYVYLFFMIVMIMPKVFLDAEMGGGSRYIGGKLDSFAFMGIVLLAIGESVIYLACQISKWGEIKKGFCLGIILGCLTAVIVVQIFVCPGAWYYTEDKYEKLFGQDSNLVAVTKNSSGKIMDQYISETEAMEELFGEEYYLAFNTAVLEDNEAHSAKNLLSHFDTENIDETYYDSGDIIYYYAGQENNGVGSPETFYHLQSDEYVQIAIPIYSSSQKFLIDCFITSEEESYINFIIKEEATRCGEDMVTSVSVLPETKHYLIEIEAQEESTLGGYLILSFPEGIYTIEQLKIFPVDDPVKTFKEERKNNQWEIEVTQPVVFSTEHVYDEIKEFLIDGESREPIKVNGRYAGIYVYPDDSQIQVIKKPLGIKVGLSFLIIVTGAATIIWRGIHNRKKSRKPK